MSDIESKEKHSKRIHQKETHIHNQVKIAKAHGVEVKPGQEHRLHEHSVVSCGNPKCMMCANPRKVLGEKTIQEKRFDQEKLWNESED